jgi:arylsulfatase A-like enzyme
LNQAGYVTGFIGKAHLGGDPTKWGFKEAPLYLPEASTRYQNPKLMVRGQRKEVPGETTEIFVNEALSFIENHKTDRWFLWLAVTAPHEPLIQHRGFEYQRTAISAPPGWPPQQDFRPEHWPRYYSTISMLDFQVGRIIEKLRNLGLRENTFIFISSDNGNMQGSHGIAGKGIWFDESVRAPALLLYPPAIKSKTVVTSPVSSVDLLPTILDYAEARTMIAPVEGVSLRSALNGGSSRTMAFSEVEPEGEGEFWQMVRSPSCKYVRLATGEEHFYDLNKDPHETKDSAALPQYDAMKKEMKQALQDWLQKTPLRYCKNKGRKAFCLN